MMTQEFLRKLAYFEAVKAEVQDFVARGEDLKSPAAVPLGIKLLEAMNDMWVEAGGKPLLVPINQEASKK